MSFKVVQKRIDATPVMYIARTLPHARLHEMSKDFDALVTYVMENGGEITGSFLRYMDESTIENMNLEICMSVKNLIAESGEIKATVLPAVDSKMAQGIHKGSYSGLPVFYQEFDKWFRDEKLQYGKGEMLEIYVNSPMEVSEDELMTEILWPVEE